MCEEKFCCSDNWNFLQIEFCHCAQHKENIFSIADPNTTTLRSQWKKFAGEKWKSILKSNPEASLHKILSLFFIEESTAVEFNLCFKNELT